MQFSHNFFKEEKFVYIGDAIKETQGLIIRIFIFHEYSPIPKSFELRIKSILPRFKRICYGQNVHNYDYSYDKIRKLIDLSYCSTETFITPNIDIIEVKQNKDITLYSLYSRYKKQVFSTRDIIQKDEIIQLKTTDKLDLNSINECYLFSGKRFDSFDIESGLHTIYIYRVFSNKEMKSRYTQYFVFEQFSYYPEYEIKYRLHNIR
ncbi:hypothetical protein M0811_10335 [Anaeramoeba ignava]|uniref:Uncharacterized protein n=1 Tax=Anaeramoeba ignava TaxID=1746090 RepID=A0A9Q0LEZ8_ANAIG|nr:hypothetical protein M0811_10335 [Anaeramoeba ignava]